MSSPWLALPDAPTRRARRIVHESWERAKQLDLDPEHLLPHLEVDEDVLADFRLAHPLAPVLPVIRKLLVRDAEGSGLLVAVGDEMGRLLWVEGDRESKRRAEEMRFVEGAGWSERRVGTSAPGTALELDHGIQIHDDEHFNRLVHGWSCTAVPVHDPETRRILGVIDITGDARAVDPHTLPLVEATAAAVEAELMVLRLRALGDSLGRPASGHESVRIAGFAPVSRRARVA
ncbi:MAG: GAF domain-containing protein, partial [Herbiconiux sp.]|nr:GAF domain-containing protein [Herbiconiux sp.]